MEIFKTVKTEFSLKKWEKMRQFDWSFWFCRKSCHAIEQSSWIISVSCQKSNNPASAMSLRPTKYRPAERERAREREREREREMESWRERVPGRGSSRQGQIYKWSSYCNSFMILKCHTAFPHGPGVLTSRTPSQSCMCLIHQLFLYLGQPIEWLHFFTNTTRGQRYITCNLT